MTKKTATQKIPAAAAAAALALFPCQGAFAQVAAKVQVNMKAGPAAAPVHLPMSGLQSGSIGASPVTQLSLTGGLPGVQTLSPVTRGEIRAMQAAAAPETVLPGPQSLSLLKTESEPFYAQSVLSRFEMGQKGAVTSKALPNRPAARKAVSRELGGIQEQVGSLPEIKEVPAAQAHGFGVTIQNLMTRTLGRQDSGSVRSGSDRTLQDGFKPSGLRPAALAKTGDAAAEVPLTASVVPGTPKTAAMSRLQSGFNAFMHSPWLLPAMGVAAVIGLMALNYWLPAIGGSAALLMMTGSIAQESGKTREEKDPWYVKDDELAPEVDRIQGLLGKLKSEIHGAIVGQDEMIDSIIMTMIAGEHILLEGVPGVAKTATVSAFAQALGADFKRIQGTPDKLPADIIGAEILQTDPETGERVIKLEKGPIFARIVLVDEINRMMPKTQAALLEAMQERQVSIGNNTLPLPRPFLMLATQNPLEQEGVNPLPEAQQDRFMDKSIVGQPNRDERKQINKLYRKKVKPHISQVMNLDDLLTATDVAEKVHMDGAVKDYIQDILDAALKPEDFGIAEEGVVDQAMVTRASIQLDKLSRVHALMEGRHFVKPEDVRAVAHRILRHRILLSYAAVDTTTDGLVDSILNALPEPEPGQVRSKTEAAEKKYDPALAAIDAEYQQVQDPVVQQKVKKMQVLIAKLKDEIHHAIVGQEGMIDAIIMSMIAGEHILLEGVPGVAKTATVSAFAKALGADFKRIQGTPDKLPADIIGAEILQTDPETGERTIKLEKGPIFARIVLVDEINRMMPKTQAALLEAMQERQVSIGNKTLPLPRPFLMLATQNPLEQEGVNPLPEAQHDRFMQKDIVEQPDRDERKQINELYRKKQKPDIHQVMTLDELVKATEVAENVHMDGAIEDYIQDVLDAVLTPENVGIGEGGMVDQAMITRASIQLEKASRINALINGRSWVTPKDVRDVAPRILRHRILLSYAAVDTTPEKLIELVLKTIPVPKPADQGTAQKQERP